jgi:hypothetical protein
MNTPNTESANHELPDVGEGVKKYYVYELREADTGKVFYVGKGCGRRLHQHRTAARAKVRLRVYNKIRSLWNRGRDYVAAKVFETCLEGEALREEERLILCYGRNRLTNLTDGGERGKGRKISDKEKKIRSDHQRGMKRGENAGRNISNAKLGERALSDNCRSDILERFSGGIAIRQLASDFQVSESTIRRIINPSEKNRQKRPKYVPATQPYRKLTASIVAEIRDLRSQGVRLQVIADNYKVSMTTIHSAVHGNSWRDVPFEKDRPIAGMNREGVKGENNVRSKITDSGLTEMKELYISGESFSEIARAYGVSVAAARWAILGITWVQHEFREKKIISRGWR